MWRISSEIQPNYDGGLMRAKWLKGGARIVKTKNQRNAIGPLYRYWDTTESTMVYVQDESRFYLLNNNASGATTTDTDWTAVNFAGISQFQPVGNWIPSTNTPVLTDAGAAGINGNFYFVDSTPTPYNVTDAALFQGATTTVVNGDMIVSVGTHWIVVTNSSTWDSIAKPQSIIDYVNGIVQPHTHDISDITGMGGGSYVSWADIADSTVAFGTVPDEKVPNVKFLRTHYRNNTQADAQYIKRIGDTGVQAFSFISGGGIDTDGAGTLNIGASNATIINIGNVSSIVNINGTVNYQNQSNLAVEDKLIRLNVNGSAGSGSGVGFEIEEGGTGVITGYFKTNGTRDGYLMNAPLTLYDAEFMMSSMTANRTYTLPNASGTLALVGSTLSTSLTSAFLWVGDGTNTAAQVQLSGAVSMTNAGVVSLNNDVVTTTKILNSAVTYAKLQNLTSNNVVLGRTTAGAGVVEELSVSGGLEFSTGTIRTSAFTGDVTKSAGSTTLAITNNAVTLAKFQQLSTTTRFLGKVGAGVADVQELDSVQATAQLEIFTTSLKGLVPSPGSATNKFLRDDGSWQLPTGTGHDIYNNTALLSTTTKLNFKNGLTGYDDGIYTSVRLGGSLTQTTSITGAYDLNIDTDNFGLFDSAPSFGSGVGIAYLGVCTTPPSTPPSAGVFLYVQLVNSTYELRIMDSAGNIKGLS